MTARAPTDIDKHVGARLRLRRSMMDMSQSELGEKLGVTFQQVQKYERGTNRIGASRLYRLAEVMEVDINWFFQGLSETGATTPAESNALYDFIASPYGLALASAFSNINDPNQRRRLIDLMRTMGEPELSDAEILSTHARHKRETKRAAA